MVKKLKDRARQIQERLETMGGTIACFSRGKGRRETRRQREYDDDEESDDDRPSLGSATLPCGY